jgi:glutamyl-tRNA reductase
MVNTNYNKRKSEVVKAESFIVDFLTEFEEWASSRQLRPSILYIKNQFDKLIDADTENKSRISKKFAGQLIQQIKKVSKNGTDKQALEIINQIFTDEK